MGQVGVSPAHAGVEAVIRTTRPDQTSQPRVCGGRGQREVGALEDRKSALRTRG